MAGIGLYGVYYAKCKKTGGVVTGYDAPEIMGKAVSASFEPNTPDENPLYANNGVAENDISAGSGGTLSLTLDRMDLETHAALYGSTVQTVQITVNDEQVDGTEIVYKGSEVSSPIGLAYIKLQQEDGERQHDVIFYREVTMTKPSDEAETMGESIEWQTPEIEGSVMGAQGDGTEPWYRIARFPSQEAAIAYIYKLFGSDVNTANLSADMAELNEVAV